MLTTFFH